MQQYPGSHQPVVDGWRGPPPWTLSPLEVAATLGTSLASGLTTAIVERRRMVLQGANEIQTKRVARPWSLIVAQLDNLPSKVITDYLGR